MYVIDEIGMLINLPYSIVYMLHHRKVLVDNKVICPKGEFCNIET
jgi:hypothetical protein